MGRQPDLERLALGRSALQDVPPAEGRADQAPDNLDPSSARQRSDGETYEQQYDDKGRPINPATEARNQSMRNAQNAVLALVGVVESKEDSEREHAKQQRQIMETREELLELEQASGERLDPLLTYLHAAFAWFPEVLVSRVQAGFYARSESFCDILSMQFDMVRDAGMRGLFSIVFAGLPTTILHRHVSRLFNEAARAGVGRLQERLNKRKMKQKVARRVNRALEFSFDALGVLIDVALLPIQYYAITQSLGLSPARPLLPGLRELLPWKTGSLHYLIWTSVVDTPGLGRLCCPAVFILLQNYFKNSCEENELTAPRIHHYPRPSSFPLDQAYLLQNRLLRWFINKKEDNETEVEPGQPALSLYPHNPADDKRISFLTYLPVIYLSERLDDLIARLLALPWSSMLMRVITQSFLLSTMPKTDLAIRSTPYVYAPFGGGPLGLFRNLGISAARDEVAGYANQLGLSLAMNCTVEIGLFFVVYKLTRWQRARVREKIASKRPDDDGGDP